MKIIINYVYGYDNLEKIIDIFIKNSFDKNNNKCFDACEFIWNTLIVSYYVNDKKLSNNFLNYITNKKHLIRNNDSFKNNMNFYINKINID